MIKHPEIIGLMAATAEGVIGQDGRLPWHYPDELDHFRKTTAGHMIVMGRTTYDGLPKTLFTDREAIVFSRAAPVAGPAITANSIAAFLSILETRKKESKIFMIGGAQLAHAFLAANLMSEFLLTRIHHLYPGDAYLDMKAFAVWPSQQLASTTDYTILRLRNPNFENMHAN